MLDFIIKYWLEFLLGAIAAGIVAVFKYAWKGIKIHIEQTLKDEFTSMNEDLSKKFEKEDAEQRIDIKALNGNVSTLTQSTIELQKSLASTNSKMQEMEDKIDTLQTNIQDMDNKEIPELSENFSVLKDGLLSIQQRAFKQMCQDLIEQTEPITYDQYEAITNEHCTYNKLGGNHDGDELFKLVFIKYSNQLK